MENLGYYNGTYGLIEEMSVPMNDRVHYFGDGVYDATCSLHHVIYLLEEHIERFFESCKELKISCPCSKEELKEILQEMILKVEGEELFVYWQVTRGTAPRQHAFSNGKANLWITITPMTFSDLHKRIALTSMEDTRFMHCNIKTLNLIPSVMAAQKAAENNCFETVFHRGDIVTECAHSNISILKDGSLLTHPNDCYILNGIAKRHLIKACKTLGIDVKERAFTLQELKQADEILITSSSNFCLVADEFEKMPVGGREKKLVEQIQELLMTEFHAYCDEKKIQYI